MLAGNERHDPLLRREESESKGRAFEEQKQPFAGERLAPPLRRGLYFANNLGRLSTSTGSQPPPAPPSA
jgi:hypothetical protein